ncbi:hypothetical protein MLD38_021700 [Melastoma candidum]|uniref:Uncharacterized protein n=1 Tax=Melastoma candidum TaxID=119954 RepID=A0ACB9QQ11_9MYRT|nr:hypothetical protein MLD38_021700 [Melastoma candidum]
MVYAFGVDKQTSFTERVDIPIGKVNCFDKERGGTSGGVIVHLPLTLKWRLDRLRRARPATLTRKMPTPAPPSPVRHTSRDSGIAKEFIHGLLSCICKCILQMGYVILLAEHTPGN